jgi:hypothetical protein
MLILANRDRSILARHSAHIGAIRPPTLIPKLLTFLYPMGPVEFNHALKD